MHTTVNKHAPKAWEHVINPDGKAWTIDYPSPSNIQKKPYHASIPDARIDHLDFECCGFHLAWAETIEELIEDIKSFEVSGYSDPGFFNQLIENDRNDQNHDRQVKLYEDSRGAKITRGEYNTKNMTAYSSL